MKVLKLTILSFLVAIVFMACNKQNEKKNERIAESKTIEKKIAYNTAEPKSMLLAVQEANGGMNKLKSLKDVEFEYYYMSPDGKKDISTERYIFDGEASWAKYTQHEINVSPGVEGEIVQFYNGESAKAYNNSNPMEDEAVVGLSQFLRQANYMWFTMMFKLSDPGLIYEYQGQKEMKGTNLDAVKVTYDPNVTGKAVNDIYIVYINPETKMVESFDFSLPAMGVEAPILHADLTYTEIDGIQVITKRMMTSPKPLITLTIPIIKTHLYFQLISSLNTLMTIKEY
jgi:hypothetical protein